MSGKGAALPPLPPLSSSLCCQRIFHQIIHSEIKRSFQSSESAPKSRASVDLGVQIFIVDSFSLPHFPKDLQPALAKAAQGTSVALTLLAFLLVVSLRPNTNFTAVWSP